MLGVHRGGASGEEGAGSTNILKLLSFLIRGQIEEIRKKGDKAALARRSTATSRSSTSARPTPSRRRNSIRAVADCYSSMGKHAEAAAALEKVPDPKAKPGTEEEKALPRRPTLLVREYRLSKDKANLKKAPRLMDAILGDAHEARLGPTRPARPRSRTATCSRRRRSTPRRSPPGTAWSSGSSEQSPAAGRDQGEVPGVLLPHDPVVLPHRHGEARQGGPRQVRRRRAAQQLASRKS